MVIDSSAIIAIVNQEPGWEALRLAIASTTEAVVCSATLVECHMVLARHGAPWAHSTTKWLLEEMSIMEISFTEEHRKAAQVAFDQFGRGRHPARLNFGDCMAYAVAKVEGRPLLFVGDDFAKTDVVSALV